MNELSFNTFNPTNFAGLNTDANFSNPLNNTNSENIELDTYTRSNQSLEYFDGYNVGRTNYQTPFVTEEIREFTSLLFKQEEGASFFAGDYRMALLIMAIDPDSLNKIMLEAGRKAVDLGTSDIVDTSSGRFLGLNSTNLYQTTSIIETGSLSYNPLVSVSNTIGQALATYRQNRTVNFIPDLVEQLKNEGRIPEQLADRLLANSKELAVGFEENMTYFTEFQNRLNAKISEENTLAERREQQLQTDRQKAQATQIPQGQAG